MSAEPRSSYGHITAEVRALAVRMATEIRPAHRSLWATCEAVAAHLGVHPSSVRNWLRSAQADIDGDARAAAAATELAAARRANEELVRQLREVADGR